MPSKKVAIKPDFFNSFPSLKRVEEAAKKGATKEEQQYYNMTLTEGWGLFSKEVDRLLDELDGLNDDAVAKGMPLEEIGRNTVVVSLAKGIIRRLINKVNDAKEACEGSTGEQG